MPKRPPGVMQPRTVSSPCKCRERQNKQNKGEKNMNCKNCKHYFEDSSVGYWECKREDYMTLYQRHDLYNTGHLENCPYYEQLPPEPEYPAPTFSEQLRMIRAERHITQAQAYTILTVPRRTYEDWERGIASPPEYVQRMIIKLLQQ